MSNKNIKTSVENRDLIMERVFDAPQELVFKTFSESEKLARWWRKKGWEIENQEFNFKPNGIWHYCMICTDKQEEQYKQKMWGKVVYQEIIAPKKIVYTDVLADEKGNAVIDSPETLVAMTFIEQEGKTKFIMRSRFESVERLQQVMEKGVVQGFAPRFSYLDDLLKELQQT
ncbi:SRPBCC domain-containing protein [Shimazuella sp. AN120528]|uniref:SRPBCC family protein n=1 Tax=Shimazuella soli TaxID=1892854 RepID=UPI001F0DBEEB|nr:SRPBCC domain-containing protein [Shimazuella soli]MCH5583517.1 SRPBCC domain-containing protein [Shimazuella soli]